MIGQIRGTLLEKQAPQLLVEVNGIGYELEAPMSTFYQLADIGQQVLLYTHFVVREDAQLLYGFATRNERLLFRTLLKANGVGPKLGLTILSSISTDEFVHCILNNDTARLICLPGIGKKTAERLVIELRDKLSHWTPVIALDQSREQSPRHPILQDAIAALVSLGYKAFDANRSVTKVDDGAASSEELIKRALREILA